MLTDDTRSVPLPPCLQPSLGELAEDAASLRVKLEHWFWRQHRPHGTWKGLERTACILLTAYVTWSAAFQYQA